jgi:ferredoxin
MSYTVRIDKRSCQSSGNCIDAAPQAFGWDADSLGEALPGARELPLERLIAIAKRCPALCITVHDSDGREIEL